MDNFPGDITANILSRLPIRSVIQCRCVCKTWCSLIYDPQFRIMHFRRTNQAITNIILQRLHVRNELYFLEDNDDGKENSEEPIVRVSKIDVPFIESPFDVFGSCNGLLCISPTHSRRANPPNTQIYIFNPATGQHMKLPDLTIPTCVYAKSLLGFGFSDSTQEFKVVQALIYKESSSSVSLESIVHVCTLGSNSWRMICNAPNTLSGEVCSSTFVNGSHHWMTIGPNPPEGPRSLVSRMAIVSFDFNVEAFGVVPKPELVINNVHHRQHSIFKCFQLGVLGGCLSLVDCSSDSAIDVWIMKSYNEESWIKQFSITQRMPSWLRTGFHIPVCFRKNGEILLLDDSRVLVSYNAESGKDGSLREEIQKLLGLESDRPSNLFLALPHVGSLIFPNQPMG